jgi:signal peptide peptidase SppA
MPEALVITDPAPLASDLVVPALIDHGQAAVPYFAQYLGPWAMEESHFRGLCDIARALDLRVHLESPQAAAAKSKGAAGGDFQMLAGGIAVIELSGALMKQVSSMAKGTSTVQARRQVRAAAADEEVNAILLMIDSPGGTVAGTRDLAQDVAAAAAKKPVIAFMQDLCASAAYWIGSQATQAICNPDTMVGSIGTYGVIHDMSGLAAMEGIKVHVVKAGAFKGAGVPGTEVSQAILEDYQRVINELNDHFLQGVAAGRKMTPARVRSLADGRVHVGQAALDLGLVDAVQSLDQTYSQILQQLNSDKRKKTMSATAANESTGATAGSSSSAAASYEQIVAECIGADAEFIVAELAAKASLGQARQDWMTEIGLRLEAAKKAPAQPAAPAPPADSAKADSQPATSVAKPGVKALGIQSPSQSTAATDGTASGDFHAAVRELEAAGLTRAKALAKVVREQPELHAAYLAEHNARFQGRHKPEYLVARG